jgi:hypothetical protein
LIRMGHVVYPIPMPAESLWREVIQPSLKSDQRYHRLTKGREGV